MLSQGRLSKSHAMIYQSLLLGCCLAKQHLKGPSRNGRLNCHHFKTYTLKLQLCFWREKHVQLYDTGKKLSMCTNCRTPSSKWVHQVISGSLLTFETYIPLPTSIESNCKRHDTSMLTHTNAIIKLMHQLYISYLPDLHQMGLCISKWIMADYTGCPTEKMPQSHYLLIYWKWERQNHMRIIMVNQRKLVTGFGW